ncbi:MAG: carotenoid biosynthesis protein, partial [Spirochaetota bacterium]
HILPQARELFKPLASFTLVVFGVVAIYDYAKAMGQLFVPWALAVYIVSMAVEILGVATGRVFGPYHYSSVLGPGLEGVPFVIGFNWIVVVLGSSAVARGIGMRGIPAILVTGLAAAAFDWVMEPAAMLLDYWAWDVSPIPLRNYVVWAILAMAAAALLAWIETARLREPAGLDRARLVVGGYLMIQLAYFIAIRLFFPHDFASVGAMLGRFAFGGLS